MIYEFKCDCGETDTVIAPISEGPPNPYKCPTCGEKMFQEFKASIYIPEYMRSSNDSMSPKEIGNRLNRSRPSGKSKVIY